MAAAGYKQVELMDTADAKELQPLCQALNLKVTSSFIELDVFRVAIGGWQPIETLLKLKGRVSQVHLKDLQQDTPTNYDEGTIPYEAFKELGNGVIDMGHVLKVSAEIGVEQCHVEQDQSADPIVSIGQSMAHLKSL